MLANVFGPWPVTVMSRNSSASRMSTTGSAGCRPLGKRVERVMSSFSVSGMICDCSVAVTPVCPCTVCVKQLSTL
jgi:hypothetical protein